MKKKKILKSIRTTLIFLMLSCLGMALFSCKSKEESGIPKVVDYGFTQEEISVEQYSLVMPETPLVLLDNGESAAVFYEVVDSKNAFVQVASGSFIAEDINGYTIKYAFTYDNQQIDSKDIKVNVSGSAIIITAESTEYIDTGVAQQIQAIAPSGAELSYKVTFDGTEILVENGAFVPEKVGEYMVEIKASKDGQTGKYTYKTFARKPSLQGEVERFDEDWRLVREKSGLKNQTEYTQINSTDTHLRYGENQGEKLLDRFGQESNFLFYETTGNTADNHGNNFLWMSLNVRNDLSYYRQLAEEGYEYVSVWVYLDSQKYHHTEMIGTEASSSSMFDISSYHGKVSTQEALNYNPVLQPNQWTELKLGLYQSALGRRANRISLLTSYNYYKNGGNFLVIDNSNDQNYDRFAEPGKLSIYISDISVVRKTDIAMVNKAEKKDVLLADVLNKNESVYQGTGYTYEAYCDGKLVSNNGKLLQNEIEDGVHFVQVKVFKDGKFFENRQIELTVVDTEKTVAFTQIDTAHIKGTQFGMSKENATSLVENQTIGGKTGTFVKIEADGEEIFYAGVKVKPTVNKAIIEAYANGYIEICYYMDFESTTGEIYNGQVALFDFGKNYPEPAQTIDYVRQTWVTVRIPVEHLLSIYDSYIAGYNNSYHTGKLFCMNNRHGKGEIYISSIILRSNTLHESGVDFDELTK